MSFPKAKNGIGNLGDQKEGRAKGISSKGAS